MRDRFKDLELHRDAIALVPEHSDDAVAIALLDRQGRLELSCKCAKGRRFGRCPHVSRLRKRAYELRDAHDGARWSARRDKSVWYSLAERLFRGRPAPLAEVEGDPLDGRIRFLADGTVLATYAGSREQRVRLADRLGTKIPGASGRRAEILALLARTQETATERMINWGGMNTIRQQQEASFWFHFAYHCLRELGDPSTGFRPAVDPGSGELDLVFTADGATELTIRVPRDEVRAALALLAERAAEQSDLRIVSRGLRSRVRVGRVSDDEIEATGVVEQGQREHAIADIERFRYGDVVWLPEEAILVDLERPAAARAHDRFPHLTTTRSPRARLPSLLADLRETCGPDAVECAPDLGAVTVLTTCDAIELSPGSAERGWLQLSVRYRFGDRTLTLRELIEARRKNLAHIETDAGWVDLEAPAFRDLDSLADASLTGTDEVQLQPLDLLRLSAAGAAPVRVEDDVEAGDRLRHLLDMRPGERFEGSARITSTLRDYQRIGVDWLLFLHENGLSGVLCDDMGLGKTHQAMALIAAVADRQAGAPRPALVVSPLTVMSHWQRKLADYAPGLRVGSHHGSDRDLTSTLALSDVVLTSYGVLRRDAEALARAELGVVVFDEVQNLKNAATQAHRAARDLRAAIKVGLTGTPIENTVGDLKALFDLTLPGYLGGDTAFMRRYGGDHPSPRDLAHLRRLTSPFLLRRVKEAVLDELPDKIEDTRTCPLSDQQAELYRQTVEMRARPLVDSLREADAKVPYLHIFAVIDLLKQICDHPALALKQAKAYESYRSGKLDLFAELLDESLDSGHKVVVFSHYLGMLDIMARMLKKRGTEFVKLTGATRKRSEVIDRFNDDPACRVFLSSLKAGGTGIDLVGGSVVIHYDRWWNAAREDQATDRVHRIGQKRAVQVFKLVSEGTLEEKIAAIIERKRSLLDRVVRPDDPKVEKLLSRNELIDLLAQL